jgi:uncharacterized protein DUF6544
LEANMSATAPDTTLRELEAQLADPPVAGSFDQGELQGLPDPVCRYLRASIAAGTPLARSARLGMRGSVKLGRWWIPFRARQISAPQHGLVWTARAGGVITGFDRYADGQGAMQWKLLGLLRMLHVQGPDLSRSAAGRVAAEAVWAPTAMVPRFGVTWAAADAHHLTASWPLDDLQLEVHYTLDDDARVRSVALDRWGDPDSTGTFGLYRFGHELTRYSSFDGVTIPSAGRAGWFYGTDRWSEGEFFRYEFTDFHLVTPASSARP